MYDINREKWLKHSIIFKHCFKLIGNILFREASKNKDIILVGIPTHLTLYKTPISCLGDMLYYGAVVSAITPYGHDLVSWQSGLMRWT